MADVCVLIVTFNEAQHIERCIGSVRRLAAKVVVVDSHSTDDTRERAAVLRAEVHEHDWVNYATQVNWALDHVVSGASWVMRLDADEYVTPELAEAIERELPRQGEDVTGLSVRRRMTFLGRPMKHGGVGHRRMLRLWRSGVGRCEERWMDEHIVLRRGRVAELPALLIDDNLNTLTWWIEKHNKYASREAIDALLGGVPPAEGERDAAATEPAQATPAPPLDAQARRIRWLKKHVYYRLPPMLRAGLYFGLRYFVQLGFLDGREGAYYHFLQAYWYRMLVDAKMLEVRRAVREQNAPLREAIRDRLGFRV